MATFRPEVPSVTRHEVTACLRALGVRRGDSLMVHSSLSSLGRMLGGAEALVDGVLDALGSEGTLAMPVMPDPLAPIDLLHSPGTVGRMSEALRRRAGVHRSMHPTHSVVALGGSAAYLVEGHARSSPCGAGSPFSKLAELGGRVLLVGVDLDRCTMMHVAEDLADVAYLQSLEVRVLGDGGETQALRIEKMPNGHRAFIDVDRQLREAGIVRLGRLGNAVLRLMPAQGLLDFGLELLARKPTAFLCRRTTCVSCRWARSQVAAAQGALYRLEPWAQRSAEWGCGDPGCEVCYV